MIRRNLFILESAYADAVCKQPECSIRLTLSAFHTVCDRLRVVSGLPCDHIDSRLDRCSDIFRYRRRCIVHVNLINLCCFRIAGIAVLIFGICAKIQLTLFQR